MHLFKVLNTDKFAGDKFSQNWIKRIHVTQKSFPFSIFTTLPVGKTHKKISTFLVIWLLRDVGGLNPLNLYGCKKTLLFHKRKKLRKKHELLRSRGEGTWTLVVRQIKKKLFLCLLLVLCRVCKTCFGNGRCIMNELNQVAWNSSRLLKL